MGILVNNGIKVDFSELGNIIVILYWLWRDFFSWKCFFKWKVLCLIGIEIVLCIFGIFVNNGWY